MTASTDPEPPRRRRSPDPAASWAPEPDGDTTLESNWLLELRRERYRSRKTGLAHEYYVVDLADAVNVIALTPDRRLILVEQFRAGSASDSLEPPGGLLDPGEDPTQAGPRELLEETGYAGDPPILLGSVWACPSLLTSRIATILITNARPVAEPKCDHGEEVHLHLVPSKEVPRLIRNGRIGHALAVQGLLWWLISELPDTPFEQPIASQSSTRQVRLRSIMAAVAAFALAFSLIRAIGPELTMLISPLLLLLPSYLVVTRLVDPMPRTTLTRSLPRLGGRSLIRALATLGLTLLLSIALALILRLIILAF